MSKILHFDINTSAIKIKKIMQNKDFLTLEIWAISDEYPNNNTSHFPFSTFEPNIKSGMFYNKPILGKFNNLTDNYEDHVFKKRYDPELDINYYDYEGGERPLGLIRESDNVTIKTDKDGLHWIVFTAVLWVKYNYRGVKKLLSSKEGKVSVEVDVFESHKDENGIEIFDEWVFNGVTILGYRKNTKLQSKPGINNARLTIFQLLEDETFNNQLETLRFAYDDLLDEDIKESESHLYTNNNKMEECEMSIEDKKLAIQNFLFSYENSESVELRDFTDDTITYIKDGKECAISYTFSEDGRVVEACKTEGEENIKMACKTDNSCKSNNSDDGCGEHGHDGEGHGDDGDHDDDHDEGHGDDNHDDDDDEHGEHGGEEGHDGEGEGHGDDGEHGHDDDDDDDDDDVDSAQHYSANTQTELFTIGTEQFTASELHDKYINDCNTWQTNYDELKKQFDAQVEENENLKKTIAVFEEKEMQTKIDTMCNKIFEVAKSKNLSEEDTENVIAKCKNREFSEEIDAIKEIAYIVMTKEDVDTNTDDSTSKEFSSKVTQVNTTKKNDTKVTITNSFDKLNSYIQK